MFFASIGTKEYYIQFYLQKKLLNLENINCHFLLAWINFLGISHPESQHLYFSLKTLNLGDTAKHFKYTLIIDPQD